MKDVVVLFEYRTVYSHILGGDPTVFAVGLDCSDGQAYDLCFFDRDDHPLYSGIVGDVSLGRKLTYDEVRKLAQTGFEEHLVNDPSKYDALSQSSWMEYVQALGFPRHYHFSDEGSLI